MYIYRDYRGSTTTRWSEVVEGIYIYVCIYIYTSTPQLPFKTPQTPSNRDHKALNRGTLRALGIYIYTYMYPDPVSELTQLRGASAAFLRAMTACTHRGPRDHMNTRIPHVVYSTVYGTESMVYGRSL